jgi:hypothetical protein
MRRSAEKKSELPEQRSSKDNRREGWLEVNNLDQFLRSISLLSTKKCLRDDESSDTAKKLSSS